MCYNVIVPGPLPEPGPDLPLRTLHLWGNGFSGPLPRAFARLTALELVDLSYNRLAGELPRDALVALARGRERRGGDEESCGGEGGEGGRPFFEGGLQFLSLEANPDLTCSLGTRAALLRQISTFLF